MPTTLLKLSCPDRVGLLARITGFVAEHGGNLQEVHQYTDTHSRWFFARLAIDTHSLRGDLIDLRRSFQPLGDELIAEWSIRPAESRMRVVLMASKLGHCLADLLWRWRSGELAFDIPCVIANHEDFREVVEREGIPFHYIPVTADTKQAAFEKIETLWREARADLVVLARYMQIIPPELCATWAGKVMNIHHSFLPSFVGANPYLRAFERGVKLIGATCHYVTSDLDEGPIIDQEVTRVEHFHSAADLLRLGRDCERLALSRSVRWHLTDRILIHGRKTVVFRD
ncbi:MAG: formyltetrahydrofolate deformylase [Verrucomicrobiaceae bacterium]|nr:MAG: formyltetrahydrofolate deformylase [Verrucomicrobiaceae bacterium]